MNRTQPSVRPKQAVGKPDSVDVSPILPRPSVRPKQAVRKPSNVAVSLIPPVPSARLKQAVRKPGSVGVPPILPRPSARPSQEGRKLDFGDLSPIRPKPSARTSQEDRKLDSRDLSPIRPKVLHPPVRQPNSELMKQEVSKRKLPQPSVRPKVAVAPKRTVGANNLVQCPSVRPKLPGAPVRPSGLPKRVPAVKPAGHSPPRKRYSTANLYTAHGTRIRGQDLHQRAKTAPSATKASQASPEGAVGNAPESNPLDQTFSGYECTCCYNEVPFDYLVQCLEGHMFCIECLQRYAQEAVYGGGKGTMKCLTDDCQEVFPESQLLRALPDGLKAKLEERIQEEELNLANLENFIRCPSCHVGAELTDFQQYFICPNKNCCKITCRYCHIAFEEHQGLSCKQVQKDTNLRKTYEERMAEAKIHECRKCRARFTKEEGCNKIVCRCGNIMCYLCRENIVGYDHFCQHVRSPGKPCSKCNSCKLFTNSEQDEELAIRHLKAVANRARRNLGIDDCKEIGAPQNA